MRLLKDILTQKGNHLKTLPILHSCEAIDLESILNTKLLKTSYCDVFNEDYLYAFYGIPSYRKKNILATGNPSYFPVCFILDYDLIPNLDRIHPCDTGAFVKVDEIKNHFHDQVKIDNLELDPNINSAKFVVNDFFETNENYVAQNPVMGVQQINPANAPAYGYTSLINDMTTSKADNRVATIELIYKSGIKLNSDNLIQVILPKLFLDDNKIEKLIKEEFKISEPIVYHSIKASPQEFFGIVYDRYLEYVNEKRLA